MTKTCIHEATCTRAWEVLLVLDHFSAIWFQHFRLGNVAKSAVPPALSLKLGFPSSSITCGWTGLDQFDLKPSFIMWLRIAVVAEVSAHATTPRWCTLIKSSNSSCLHPMEVGLVMKTLKSMGGCEGGPGYLASPICVQLDAIRDEKLQRRLYLVWPSASGMTNG